MGEQGSWSNQVLGGKYLLGDLLGQGRFGAVYKASNQMIKRSQAIKLLLEQHLSNPKMQARFIREAQTLGGLDHPNIVPLHDFGFEGTQAYLVMPYVDGGTLQELLQKTPMPLHVKEIEIFLEQICPALDYIHSQGLVHLDLKPANVLRYLDGRPLITDFGLTHLLEGGMLESRASVHLGAPFYMAPEQVLGRPGPSSDIYALGVILCQILTGKLPFEESSWWLSIQQPAMDVLPSFRFSREDLPHGLEEVVRKALANRPEDRYTRASELLDAYKQAISRDTFDSLPKLSHEQSIFALLAMEELPPLAINTSSLPEFMSSRSEALVREDRVLRSLGLQAQTRSPRPSGAGSVRQAIPFLWRSSDNYRSFLIFGRLLPFCSGFMGTMAFYLPWFDLQTHAPDLQDHAASGLALTQSSSVAQLLWMEPFCAATLIFYAVLSRRKRGKATKLWWVVALYRFALPLLTFAFLFIFSSLLAAQKLYSGAQYSFNFFAYGFFLALLSLVLGCGSCYVESQLSEHPAAN